MHNSVPFAMDGTVDAVVAGSHTRAALGRSHELQLKENRRPAVTH